MLQVEIGKINLVGNRIMPNIFCIVSFGTEICRSKTHYGTSHANINEVLRFAEGRTHWMHLQIRHKQSTDNSSGDEVAPSKDSTLMCSCDEDISNVQIGSRNLVRLLGKPDYCNSGLVEYTIKKMDNVTRVKNIFEQQSLKSQSNAASESELDASRKYSKQSVRQSEEESEGTNKAESEEELQEASRISSQRESSQKEHTFNNIPSPTNKASFRKKIITPQYEVGQPKSPNKQSGSVNTSFNNSFSRQERSKFQFGGMAQPKQIPTSDEEGVKFIGHITRMLGEGEKNSKPQSRGSSNANLNFSKMSEQDRKFVPVSSPKFNKQMTFALEGDTDNAATSAKQRGKERPLVQTKNQEKDAARKLSIIREGSPDKLTDNENVRQRKRDEAANQQALLKQSTPREGHRSENSDSDIQLPHARKTQQDYHTIQNIKPEDIGNGNDNSPDEDDIVDRRAMDRMGVYRLNPNTKKKQSYRQRRQKRPWNKKFQFNEKYNTQGDESVQEGSEGLGTESPYQSGGQPNPNSINHYLDSSYFSATQGHLDKMIPINITKKSPDKKVNSFQPITHSILPGRYLVFALSCNVHYLKNKNFRNRMSMEVWKDNTKIGRTSLCTQKFPPYQWQEYFQVEGFDELKFILIYHEAQLPHQSEREESMRQQIKDVQIGTAVLKRAAVKESMSFVLPMEFKGHKMGELSLKLNYEVGGASEEEDKLNQLHNVSAHKQNAGQQFYKAVSLPGITLGLDSKIVPSGRLLNQQHQPLQLTQANREQLLNGLKNLKKEPEVLDEKERTGSPPRLIYPRSKVGFFSGKAPVDSASIAKMYDRQPEREPQTIQTSKFPTSNKRYEKAETPVEEPNLSLNLNTIIFKNYDLTSPVNDTFLVIEFGNASIQTESIHEKDILWTKQNIVGNFNREDAAIEFSVFEQVGECRSLIGKNKLLVADIRPKHRMYSYKLPIFSHRNQTVGELLLHYEFRKIGDAPTINRERLLSCSIDNHTEDKFARMRNFNASQQKSLVERYMEKVVQSTYTEKRQALRRHRQPFYYTGKNVKFGQAPRFRAQSHDQSVRSMPGPGSYCLPSVFDRHKVIE